LLLSLNSEGDFTVSDQGQQLQQQGKVQFSDAEAKEGRFANWPRTKVGEPAHSGLGANGLPC
jgi:hypothetical protein